MKKRLLILIAVGVMLFGGFLFLVLGTRGSAPTPTATPTPSPSATPDPEVAAPEEAAKQFAAAYFSYENPASNDYLASIRPLVTDSVYQNALRSAGAASKFTIPAQRAKVTETRTSFNPGRASVTSQLTLEITESAGVGKIEKIEAFLVSQQGRWLVDDVKLLSSDEVSKESPSTGGAR